MAYRFESDAAKKWLDKKVIHPNLYLVDIESSQCR